MDYTLPTAGLSADEEEYCEIIELVHCFSNTWFVSEHPHYANCLHTCKCSSGLDFSKSVFFFYFHCMK